MAFFLILNHFKNYYNRLFLLLLFFCFCIFFIYFMHYISYCFASIWKFPSSKVNSVIAFFGSINSPLNFISKGLAFFVKSNNCFYKDFRKVSNSCLFRIRSSFILNRISKLSLTNSFIMLFKFIII